MWRLHKKIHPSWLITLACAVFVVGVWLAVYVRVPWWAGIVCAPFAVTAMAIARAWVIVPLVFSALFIGLGYGSMHLGQRDVYEGLAGSIVALEGRVKEDPSISASGRTSLQIDSVSVNGMSMSGTVLVGVLRVKEVKRGDVITAKGVLEGPFGSFPATMSILSLQKVVRPVPGDVGRAVRDWFSDKVREMVPEPQASLGTGFLTGQKSALPVDLAEALKVAGLTHIVVASGYNLTILVRMARRLFAKVSKYLSAMSAGVMIVMFVLITGLSPSMTRAGLVSGLSLLAWYYGHAFHPLILLPFAAAITVAFQPSYVWGDMGWQLSFSAFAGVMVLAPLLQRYFFGKKAPGVLRQIAGETVSAHLATMPIIALSFGVVSNVAIIANLLVVPLVPLAMLLTFLCGAFAVLNCLWLADIIALPTTWLLTYMTNVAIYVSELEWAQLEIAVPGVAWLGYGVLLALSCVYMQRATRYDLRKSNPVL